MLKNNFFGRKVYLDILQKRVSGLLEGYRQNIAIIGDEMIGKTFLLFKFLDKFYDNRIIVIYLEIRPEAAASFFNRFAAGLLYNFLIPSGIPLREDLDYLIRKAERFIPKTAQKIKTLTSGRDKKKTSGLFVELLWLCELIYQETGKHCILILDEFHNLESLGLANLYREWSKLLILQKNTMYIITSSLKFKTKTILSKNLSLLFGNFELLTVEPFDAKASEEYLDKKLAGLSLNRGLRNFIIHFTGGHPFYLEIISEALLKSSKDNLADTLERLLCDTSGLLNQRFSNYIKRFLDLPHSNDYLSILYLVSDGRNRIKDIATLLHKTKKELIQRINYLLEIDTVTRSADFLKINDRVFGFWLKFVYQEKLRTLAFDARGQNPLFRDRIESMIQDFLNSSRQPLMEKMSGLLRLFEDELIQIEKKKIRLNHFREIKPLEFNNRSWHEGLIGRSQDSLWIMAFKDDSLTEDDVADFSRECRKYRNKLQRKILVTLKEIDANTRLKALEEKIWTWDINSLNQILDLFSIPRVIP